MTAKLDDIQQYLTTYSNGWSHIHILFIGQQRGSQTRRLEKNYLVQKQGLPFKTHDVKS